MTRFANVRIQGAHTCHDDTSGITVLHVSSSHALVQAAGYLKYVLAKDSAKNLFYRGQTRVYEGLPPSLFRGLQSQAGRDKYVRALKDLIRHVRSSGGLLTAFPEEMTEPLLQHYGIRTSWIDLVDNVWIALWFACYRARAADKTGKYLHFEKRIPRREKDHERFAYIVLIETDMVDHSGIPGLWRGPDTELADLRGGVPSVFVRPHAQHGVLFRLRGGLEGRKMDYSSAVAGVIRVDLSDAIEWLGQGRLLDVHALFPPPHYDDGYRILLERLLDDSISPDPLVGTLHYIFP